MTTENNYAQVIVDIPSLDSRAFSYIIPNELKEKINIGIPVLVPFGNQGSVNAYVVGLDNNIPEGIKAKSIYEILDEKPVFNAEYLKFLEQIASYYCCSLQTVINAALPINFFSKMKRIASLTDADLSERNLTAQQKKIIEIIKIKPYSTNYVQKKSKLPPSKFYEAIRSLKQQNIVEINNVLDIKTIKTKTEKYIKLINENTENKRYKAILDKLKQEDENLKLSDFLEIAKTTTATIKKLEEAKNVEIIEEDIYRNPLNAFKNKIKEDLFQLTFEQQEAFEKIKKNLPKNQPETFLLHGITGSGKTEIYIHLLLETMKLNKTAIVLAPEIPLASQLAKRISAKIGEENVVIWHSNLSEGERFDVWEKIRNNQAKVVIGARSAIFAPVQNLGLIVIDEEHESSYKQTSPNPRYNAKDLAYKRAELENLTIVLGSATPDIATYYKALNKNNIIALNERVGAGELPKVHIIDMRQEQYKNIFSVALKTALENNLKEKKQSILLLNRRGFATYNQCLNCGYTAECPKCSINMILHKSNKLKCHYCGHEQQSFSICPQCKSENIKHSGLGTQRVEAEAIKLFPNAKIARLDSDVMSKKNAHIEILEAFSKGETDILIGTQMIAKGLDIHNVTLVGVLMVDSLFNFPDFRSSERAFQLLTQVAGRAGRGDFKGKVYFQTYNPEFFAIKSAKKQNYENFYMQDIKERYELSYPPFSNLIRLIISSNNENKALIYAETTANQLNLFIETLNLQEKINILGPASCLISKIKNEYRYQILIKNKNGNEGHNLITKHLKEIKPPENIKFLIDVDPSDML